MISAFILVIVLVGFVAQKVASACNVLIDASTAKTTGTTTFVFHGTKESIFRAKRMILAKVSVKVFLKHVLAAEK